MGHPNKTSYLLIHLQPFKRNFERLNALHLDSVTVLSPDYVISMPLLTLLSRPPSFIPAPERCNHRLIFALVLDFVRKLQWATSTITRHLNKTNDCRFGFVRSNRWPPQGSLSSSIRRLSQKILSASHSLLFSEHRCYNDSNLSPPELQTLTALRADPTVVVRPADKGGRWVLMDSTQYTLESDRLLSDTAFYREIPSPVSSHMPNTISTILESLCSSRFISKRELRFLSPPSSPRIRRFNLLPKIHKQSWPSPNMPPGRPVIADISTDSSNVSRLIDFFLFPLVRKSKSFLLDSSHLVAILRSIALEPSTLFCTLDVRSLYTNVPIAEGILRVQRAFSRYPDPKRPDNTILQLLHLCLTHNDFSCNDRLWLQTKGVAMGKAFGGSFACLYLTEWESGVFNDSHAPNLFVRFQDDILMLWEHGENELHRFHERLNSLDPNIQTDLTFSRESIRFLDLEIYRASDNSIGYRIGFKETDSHNLLPRDSHHANHVHRGVLFSQVLRWASRSCSRPDFDYVCHTVFPHWRAHGITRSSIRSAVKRVFSLTSLASSWTQGFRSCGSPRCSACPFARNCLSFKIPSSGVLYPICMNLSCASTHVVYVINCSSCNITYVGQTSNTLRQRISEHLRAIRNNNLSAPLTSHFRNQCDIQHLNFFAIDRSFSDSTRFLKERKWIQYFRSLHPSGLNRNAGVKKQTVNLVTFPANCTARLNATIRQACSAATDLEVRLSYKANPNIKNLLR